MSYFSFSWCLIVWGPSVHLLTCVYWWVFVCSIYTPITRTFVWMYVAAFRESVIIGLCVGKKALGKPWGLEPGCGTKPSNNNHPLFTVPARNTVQVSPTLLFNYSYKSVLWDIKRADRSTSPRTQDLPKLIYIPGPLTLDLQALRHPPPPSLHLQALRPSHPLTLKILAFKPSTSSHPPPPDYLVSLNKYCRW